MKLFTGSLMYGRCQLDVRFCCKSVKAAAERLCKSRYDISRIFSVTDCTEVFPHILVKPYNHISKEILGNSGEITYEHACKKIDSYYGK